MGGSIAGAIRRRLRDARVIGYSRSQRKIALAKRKRLIHEGFTHLGRAVKRADFIIVCSPVDRIPSALSKIDSCLNHTAIVTDVGSTKGDIVRWAERRKFRHLVFVGSHPFAGSHLSGIEHADPALFQDALVFVTPARRTNIQAVRTVSGFWRKLGLKVKRLSPDVHDQLLSQTSHLPHALASLLMETVSSSALRFVSSGFLDTTRVAQGDPRLWAPIFSTNAKYLISDLNRLERALHTFRSLLKRGSERSIRGFLERASKKRSSIPIGK